MDSWKMARKAISITFFSLGLASFPSLIYAKPSAPKTSPRLVCQAGTKVQGGPDGWTPVSKCQSGTAVVGLQRIDLLKHSTKDVLVSVNDFICDAKGCRAWCQNSACTVEARCCHLEWTED